MANLGIQASSSSGVLVVFVPFPAQSHMNQLLQLSHIISSHNIPVHYVGSALHNAQVKSRASHVLNDTKTSIQFHDFPIPHFPSPLPNDTKYTSHLIPSFETTVKYLRQPFSNLLTLLSETAKRVVIIHDPLTSSVVQDATSFPNTEAYVFNCTSAVSGFALLRAAFGLEEVCHPEIPSLDGCISPEIEAFHAEQFKLAKSNKSGQIFNTSWVIEGYFLDFILEKEREMNENMKFWVFGPLETGTIFKEISSKSTGDQQKDHISDWLNKQETNSVLYISFGTTTFMKDEQIKELAIGLEQSEVKFIWVLRDADKGNIFDEVEVRRAQLPKGFEERVKRKGIMVRDWAPQLEILGHSSTGGFMSHCGWNSCLESISLGVPIATWPMHSDQPMNAVLITEKLKVGVAVREWARNEELVSSSVIKDVVKRLMASKEGDEIRKRAEELGNELRKATEEGGVSRIELDSFIAHITR